MDRKLDTSLVKKKDRYIFFLIIYMRLKGAFLSAYDLSHLIITNSIFIRYYSNLKLVNFFLLAGFMSFLLVYTIFYFQCHYGFLYYLPLVNIWCIFYIFILNNIMYDVFFFLRKMDDVNATESSNKKKLFL
jgi:hypothetical protein